MTRLIIKAQRRSFRLIFSLEYEYDEVRLIVTLYVFLIAGKTFSNLLLRLNDDKFVFISNLKKKIQFL